MTFNVAAIPSAQFIGAPVPFPTKLGTVLKQIPRVYSLFFNWSLYGISNSLNQIAVPVNLAQNNQSAQLDAIRGVYIDNTGSDAAIYVYFPDTGCIVTCAQFSTNWQPVLTNVLQCVVIGKGFVTGDQSQTTVFLTNETIPPGESAEVEYSYPQYLASPRISRGVNQFTAGFSSPAIGDQWQYVNAPAGTNTTSLFGTPYTAGGYITLTNWHVDGLSAGTFTIQSTGNSGVLFTGANAVTMDALQLKLLASETWQFKANATTGIINALFCFSYQGSGTAETLFNFGNINSPKNNNRGISSNFAGVQFTAPQSGSILSVNISCENGPAALTCQAQIYSDNAGHPGNLLGSSQNVTVQPGGSTISYEFDFPTPLPQIVSGTKYWVVIPQPAGTNFNIGETSAIVANINGSGDAATVVGIGINSGHISAGDNYQVQVNCQQP